MLTPSDAAHVAGAMVLAYERVTGRPPPARSSWLIPLAQSALETGHWLHMKDNNTGNVGPGRSYPTLLDGAVAQMAWLAKHHALDAADANDINAYGDALEKGCYVGCPWDCGGGIDPATCKAQYMSAVASIAQRYKDVVPVYDEQPPPKPSTGSFPWGLAALTTAAVGVLAWRFLPTHVSSAS